MAAQERKQTAAMESFHPKKEDLMVDQNVVESGVKEETHRRVFSLVSSNPPVPDQCLWCTIKSSVASFT